MTQYSGVVIESQVDWLTASAHGLALSGNLEALARHLGKEQRALGNRTKTWRLMGYEGTHCGAVEWGRRDNAACLIRLIGDQASIHLSDVLSVADQVTRLDLAVTWRAEPPDPLLGANTYALAELYHRDHPRSAVPWHVGDADGGYTCYLGHRDSENFLRVYDKGAESVALQDAEGAERYRACWRYELEVKGGLAGNLAEVVDSKDARAAYIQTYLHLFARQHGLEPPFPASGAASLLPGFRRRSDADTRLRHLAKNVRPTLEWLGQVGRLADALTALGLESSNLTHTKVEPREADGESTVVMSPPGTRREEGES